MTINLLDYFLFTQISAFFLIFCRVGSALMVMPGIGEIYVSPRVRLLLALAMSFLLTPILQAHMPLLPEAPLALGVAVTGEVLIGSFIGVVARTTLTALHTAGTLIAQQSSLAVASIFDPTSGGQSPVISNMLTLTAMTLFFSLDLHHLLIAALVQSYDVFAAGELPSMEDMNQLHLRLVADAFTLGVLLAAPHLAFSLIFYLAGGLMTRLMSHFQVFFVMMSPQIVIAFLILLAIMPTMLDIFMHFMQTQIGNFVHVDGAFV